MSLILDLIFPKYCLKCNSPGEYFCPQCLKQQFTNSPQYSILNQPYQGHLSLFKYHDLTKQLITEIKYEFVTDIINSFIKYSASIIRKDFPHLLDYWQQNNFILIPIPLYFYRQNWRGFNQSVLIGQKLAKNLGLQFSDEILFRTKNTHIQAKLSKKSAKKDNLKDAFICSGQKIPPNIILFDDVATTFSTLKSALKTISNFDDQIHCWFLTLAGH